MQNLLCNLGADYALKSVLLAPPAQSIVTNSNVSSAKGQKLPFSLESQPREGLSQFQLGLGGASELLSPS